MLLLLLQEATQNAADLATPVAQKTSLLQLLLQAGWYFIVPLLILSVIAVYIFIERFITIRKAGRIDASFMDQIQNYMIRGDISGAADLCARTDTPISRMVEKGIKRIGKPLRSIEVAIENEGKIELLRLENRLATLATIAGAAPMIGFLGTVTGMINAFYKISTAGVNVDPSMLAGGIYQALITTAVGLTIGIIAFIGYNLLVSQVEKVVYKMEYATIQFIDFLQEPATV